MIQVLREYFAANSTTRHKMEQDKKAQFEKIYTKVKGMAEVIGEPAPDRKPTDVSYGNTLRAVFRIFTSNPNSSMTEEQRERLDAFFKANSEL